MFTNHDTIKKAIIRSQHCQRNWDLSKEIPEVDLNLFMTALGSWFIIPLLIIVNSGEKQWVPLNLDDGFLQYYFFLLVEAELISAFLHRSCLFS